MNRLGRIARLHHQPDACVQIINALYGFNAMEVQQAFVKVGTLQAASAPAMEKYCLPPLWSTCRHGQHGCS